MLPVDVELQGVKKKFGNHVVLNNISLRVFKGDIFGVIGSSGAGKTTMLRSIMGLYKIDAGRIFIRGVDVHQNTFSIRHTLGFATQDNCFYEELTVSENLEYFGRLYGLSKKAIVNNSSIILKMVELDSSKHLLAKDLSGCMKRRLDVACSLIHNPSILILDEPTAGLDPLLRKEMWKLIERIHNSGTTIILSSHLLEEMEHVCNRVVMIKNGVILAQGSPEELKNLYSKDQEIHIETYPANYQLLIEGIKSLNLPISSVSVQGHKLVVYSPQAEKIVHEVVDVIEQYNEKLLELEVRKPSLSEVFEVLSRR